MKIARFARALLVSACLLLVLPAFASATVFEVDTVVDLTSGAGKECGAGEECSLRVALEKSNASSAVADTILFDLSVFQGQTTDVIFPATALPTITSPVEINGGTCLTAAGVNGPCVGVQGLSGEAVFKVEADDTSIYGLVIGGGSFGISVINSSDGFILRGSWIGFNFEGGSTENTNVGVFIDPGSDGATIGGTEAVRRNVFGNNGVGLDVEGADETTVQGNYFGVTPKGDEAAPNSKDIEVTDSTSGGGFEAENTVIGATVNTAAIESTDCDGGCNVISGALGTGIDLHGNGSGQNEAPASGPTTVQGNYVGLDAAGTNTIPNAQFDVLTGAAAEVLVGGFEPGAENFIAGGGYGVYGENGDDLEVVGNVIGIGPTGAALTPPSTAGIFVFALSLSSLEAGAAVIGNVVRMTGGIGIEHRFIGAEIVENEVEGGNTGILTKGSGNGSLIAGNFVQGSEDSGIILQNPDNEVLGNEVVEAGEAGIEIDPTAEIDISGNVLGGDLADDENAIFGSNDAAIEIFGIEESRNEVRRNRGSENGGPNFIRLRSVGLSEPGNGVDPPKITSAGKTEATGTAKPGALVRIFRKATTEAGEIAGFVAEAEANGSGQWKATYVGLPEGTLVAATQTLDGGTSELSGTSKTPPDPPSGCPAVPSQCPPPPPPPPDKTAPKVTIKKAPKAKSTATTAKFKFVSNEAGSTFQCKLDKGKFKKCKSPKTYKKLKPGKHVFKVKATDGAGNVSKALTRKFTVLE
jgi:hypothetical protein